MKTTVNYEGMGLTPAQIQALKDKDSQRDGMMAADKACPTELNRVRKDAIEGKQADPAALVNAVNCLAEMTGQSWRLSIVASKKK